MDLHLESQTQTYQQRIEYEEEAESYPQATKDHSYKKNTQASILSSNTK